MPGRPLLDETSPAHGLSNPQNIRRRAVLRETLDRFTNADPADKYHQLARQNVTRWRSRATASTDSRQTVQILRGDWGEVTQRLTREHGVTFAALNMANAYVPGGGYVEGSAAQEENMFRRTDCHFSIDSHSYDEKRDRYRPEWTALVSGENGEVFLDTERPRVCLRGPEDLISTDLGYAWLDEDQIFPFYELRSAAVDRRDGSSFAPANMNSRIAAQLDTLARHDIKHVVLGAFGCGAFGNPARQVAEIYHEEIARRRSAFRVIAFAIFHAGYGPDNHAPFDDVFREEIVLG